MKLILHFKDIILENLERATRDNGQQKPVPIGIGAFVVFCMDELQTMRNARVVLRVGGFSLIRK